ncbi:MAG: UvrB/UvrC motif-containing protein [Planctomycetota bacterium]|nr:UvrB/UvrC motif-containing protein [Planctomycetota bacterium]
MKCHKCPKVATMHITEIVSKDNVQECHFCEECAQKYLQEEVLEKETIEVDLGPSITKMVENLAGATTSAVCEACAMQFADFRNSGRLGCPHDYTVFHDELLPYLENIHGETKHCGKFPTRYGTNKNIQKEIDLLRKQLQSVIQKEKYEEAAGIRDKIRLLENQ